MSETYLTVKDSVFGVLTTQEFFTTQQLEQLITSLKKYFHKISSDDELVLWIKGYNISDVHKRQGFMGGYAKVLTTEHQVEGKESLYQIELQNVPMPLTLHPLYNYGKRPFPNMGYVAFKFATKKLWFKEKEPLQAVLEQMHKDFPDSTEFDVLDQERLYFQVYSRERMQEGYHPISSGSLFIHEDDDDEQEVKRGFRLKLSFKERKNNSGGMGTVVAAHGAGNTM
jgi:hypothetical protein